METLLNKGALRDYAPSVGRVDRPANPTTPRDFLVRSGGTLKSAINKDTSTIILILRDGSVLQAKSIEAKRKLVAGARPEDRLLLVWPGSYSTDSFYLDEREECLRALGLKPIADIPTHRVTDSDGTAWVDA